MELLEGFFEVLFIDLIKLTGIFVRWSSVAAWRLLSGEHVVMVSFKKYHRKMTSDKDPSNRMSDGIIHWLLGIGTWLGAILLML